ncbi:hypothetical protein WJX75_004566 [Coccomyxa subellipsoidea]|uniref:Uncharacterized protein n=1 Tax=Coccomyxa subellipsoidea TaxID=248742 RepID=A0ABR2YR73_9CHLO
MMCWCNPFPDERKRIALTSRTLFNLAGRSSLWQHVPYGSDCGAACSFFHGDLIFLAARLCMSRALHLPPQVFVVQADTGRSSRFPIIVRTLDLRSILCSPDVDEIASNAASAITDKPTIVFKPSESLKELREALKNAATWCISLLGWEKMDRHKAFRRLELWLGPTELLTQHASQMDVGLLLELRHVLRVGEPKHLFGPYDDDQSRAETDFLPSCNIAFGHNSKRT